MKDFVALSALVCSLISMTNAGLMPAREVAALDTLGSMTYVGPITPGGENVTLSGTAEGIHAQILVLNPSFNPDDFEVLRNAKETINKRAQASGCCRCSYAPYNQIAYTNPIRDGGNYLQSLPGNCGTGDGGVARTTCGTGSAIFLVNQHPAAVSTSCWQIGAYALQMAISCNDRVSIPNRPGFDIDYVNGQICDSGGWCTIVAASSC